MTFVVHVPCATFSVRVRTGPSDALTPFEQLVLEAIHRGVASFAELAELFGLGDRVMLDLVFDFWRAGYVLVDTVRGAVLLSAEATEAVRRRRFDLLAPVGTSEETRELMQDQVTGHVLSSRYREQGGWSHRSIVPAHGFSVSTADVGNEELLAALAAEVRTEGPEKRVLSANLSPSHFVKQRRRAWLAVNVRTAIDADGTLQVEVLQSAALPFDARVALAQGLQSIAATEPLLDFSRYLLDNVDARPWVHVTPAERLARLRHSIDDLPRVDKGVFEAHHRQLVADATELLAAVTTDDARAVEVIAGVEDHTAVITEMIDAAEQQLVLSSATIGAHGLEAFIKPLEAAIARGVQVVMLWGPRRDDQLDAAVRRRLFVLKEEAGGSLLVSARASSVNTRFVVQDDRRLLVTAMNPLHHGQDFELGIKLDAKDHPRRARAIEAVLAAARDRFPDYLLSRNVLHLTEDFAGLDQRLDSGGLDIGQMPDPPPGLADERLEASAKLWTRSWEAYAQRIEHALVEQEHATQAEVLTDARHVGLLTGAFTRARRRVLVCSRALDAAVLSDVLLTLIEERLKEGVEVSLVYGGARAEDVARLDRLAERFEHLRHGRARSQAEVLVFDDDVVVGSFALLKHTGLPSRGSRGRRQRAELGLHVRDAVLARQTAEAVFTLLPSVRQTQPSQAEPVEAAPRAATGDYEAVLQVRAVLDELESPGDEATSDEAATLADAVDRSHSPADFIAELVGSGLEADRLRPAIAQAVLSGRLSASERRRWLGVLVLDHLDRGQWMEAAVLRTEIDVPHLPETAVLALVATVDDDQFERLAAAVELPAEHPDWVSLAVLGALRLLARGVRSADVETLLEYGTTRPGPAWAALIAKVEWFWEASDGQPCPFDALSVERASSASQSSVAEAWTQLGAALSAAEGKRFGVPWVDETTALVHAESEPFGQLRALCDAQDREALTSWLAAHRRASLEDLIDEAARLATGTRTQQLHHNTREGYLKLLRRARKAAVELAALPTTEHVGVDPKVLDLANELVDAVAQGWEDLVAEVESADPAQRVVLQFALDRLAPFAGRPT